MQGFSLVSQELSPSSDESYSVSLNTFVSIYIKIVDVVTGSTESNLMFIRSFIVCLHLFEETLSRNIIPILEKSMWYQCKADNLW
jgi:hypothetical protein